MFLNDFYHAFHKNLPSQYLGLELLTCKIMVFSNNSIMLLYISTDS